MDGDAERREGKRMGRIGNKVKEGEEGMAKERRMLVMQNERKVKGKVANKVRESERGMKREW